MAGAPANPSDHDARSAPLLPPNDPSALISADHLARLGTLVAGVAHEINNPIAYVMGNLSDLRRLGSSMREALLAYRGFVADAVAGGAAEAERIEAKLEEAGGLDLLEELVADALEGADRIRGLVRDLLELSRDSGHTTAPVDVHRILDSTLRLVGRDLSGAVLVERDFGASRLVDGDHARLGQVFLNLLTNAIDACQPPDPARHRVRVRSRDCGSGVCIEIEDTGRGIPGEIETALFTPFFTTKESGKGTGLGLFLSRRIVEAHGGSIDFRGAPQGGTIFSVWLPEASAD